MPIVTCPTCQARYDPGVDEELGNLKDMPGDASLKVVCPSCGQWLRLPEHEPIEAPNAPKHVLEAMKSQSKLVADVDRPARRREESDDRPRRRHRDADDDEDRPRRRRRDDDDIDRPRRRWADQDREDIDDDPRGPRPGRGDGMGVAAMIVGIASCVVGLLGFCCILFGGLGLIGGVVAIILGFVGRGQNPASGQAKAGIITGFLAIGLSIAFLALNLALGLGRVLLK